MPVLTFDRSTFGLSPRLDQLDIDQQIHINLVPYAKRLLCNRIQDAFRRKTLWISRRREKRNRAEGDELSDRDFVGKAAARGGVQATEDDVDTSPEESGRQTRGSWFKRFKTDSL